MTVRNPMSRPTPSCLVAIVGGSGSGKTWLAGRLHELLGSEATRLSADDFYLDRGHLSAARRARINFDHPRAIDTRMLAEVLRSLADGKATQIPTYDFATHRRGTAEQCIQPRSVVLVDGLWLLRTPVIRRLFSLKIFLDCPHKVRLERRLARDCQERGRSEHSIRTQFCASVAPMHRRFVDPQKEWSDIIFTESPSDTQVKDLSNTIRTLVQKFHV